MFLFHLEPFCSYLANYNKCSSFSYVVHVLRGECERILCASCWIALSTPWYYPHTKFVVQIWDMRRADRVERQLTAHSGPVFTINWHPEEKNCFATAGRDKMIKVRKLSKGITKYYKVSY